MSIGESSKGFQSRLAHMDKDRPMTLVEACEKVFSGAITPASLKAEARRGNLVMSKIGRAYFVTLADINEMIERCRVKAQVSHASSETLRPSSTERSASARAAFDLKFGKSTALSIARSASARAALKAELDKPKKPSKPTAPSPTNTSNALDAVHSSVLALRARLKKT